MNGYSEVKDKVLRLLRPYPVYLLFTGSIRNGDVNVMAESWVTPISKTPPRIGVVVEKSNYSWTLLKRYPWFTLAVPDSSQAELVKFVGTWSRREIDKVEKTGIRVVPWEKDASIPVPLGFLGVLVSRVLQYVDFGSSELVVGEVVGAYVAPGSYSVDDGWISGRAEPLLHKVKHRFTVPCKEL
ncbi:MAG: flavin reductase family protein, partial [Desulfurococcales archaeon]|nr:flavin reductase family protein [Desulfurococcales archaeon]